MFSFKNNGERSPKACCWFIGVHISSSVRKLEVALLGSDSSRPGASLTLQKSLSFDLPEEITSAYEEVLEAVRTEQDAKASSPNGKVEESDGSVPSATKSPAQARGVKKIASSLALSRLSLLRLMIVTIQEEAISELLADSGIEVSDIVAVAIADPGIWSGPFEWEPELTRYSLSSGSLLAERTGMNVIDSLVPNDWNPKGHGRAFLSFPYWILLADQEKARLVVDLGETARWTYLPPNKTPNAWRQTIYREVVPCGSLLNLFAAQASKGASRIDEGGKLSVQGRSPNELLELWRESQSLEFQKKTHAPRRMTPSFSGILNETFFFDALKAASQRKYSSIDALCAAVHWIDEQIKESINADLSHADPSYEIILTGAAKQNGLLFSLLSESAGTKGFHKLSEYGFVEDSFDAVAVATLGILFASKMPAALSEPHGVKTDALLGRVAPGTLKSWGRFLDFANSSANL